MRLCLSVMILLVLVGLAGAEPLVPGGPYVVGEPVNLSGQTNFNTDNSVLVEIYPASFGPVNKYDPSMAGGGSQDLSLIHI